MFRAIFDGDQEKIAYAERVIAHPRTGTIPCMAVDSNGDISATTTRPVVVENSGRVGIHRLLARMLRGQWVGGGSTGKGEETSRFFRRAHNYRNDAAGKSPTDACLEAMARMRALQNGKEKAGTFHIYFYAINRMGPRGRFALAQRI